MRPLLAGCLLSVALTGCTSLAPVTGGTDSSPPPAIDARTGLLVSSEQLAPGTMTVDVGDTSVWIHSMPAAPGADIVDYVVQYAESGDIAIHLQTEQSVGSYPVQIMRARFYADNYVFKAEDNVTGQVYAQKTVYIPDYSFYAPAPSTGP
ncbi:MAG TPA: hypothetical protein V6D47_17515 [Oscillatoriaceae cyanobacterium]